MSATFEPAHPTVSSRFFSDTVLIQSLETTVDSKLNILLPCHIKLAPNRFSWTPLERSLGLSNTSQGAALYLETLLEGTNLTVQPALGEPFKGASWHYRLGKLRMDREEIFGGEGSQFRIIKGSSEEHQALFLQTLNSEREKMEIDGIPELEGNVDLGEEGDQFKIVPLPEYVDDLVGLDLARLYASSRLSYKSETGLRKALLDTLLWSRTDFTPCQTALQDVKGVTVQGIIIEDISTLLSSPTKSGILPVMMELAFEDQRKMWEAWTELMPNSGWNNSEEPRTGGFLDEFLNNLEDRSQNFPSRRLYFKDILGAWNE